MSTASLPSPAPATRNLTVPLAEWLRKMGFVVLEQGGTDPVSLEGTWRATDGTLYQVSYAYAPTGGIFQLLASLGDIEHWQHYHGLVHKAEINRIREARFLLLSNVFYRDSRQSALDTGALLPTHAQPAA